MQTKEDFDIKNHTSFKIGGKINKIYFPENFGELQNLPQAIVIGNLSNTLISSDGIDFPIISTLKLDKFQIKGTNVIAQAGVKGPKLSQFAQENGLTGLEFMIGFPGSVGGEVFMNAGAHGQCIADCLKYATVFDGKNMIKLTNQEMEFEYRHSICQNKNYVVLEAEFELQKADKDDIKKRMTDNLEFRKAHQPSLSLPNCGSIFKNPANNSAGKLLDECGVKGLQTGGAKVWENHANFIVNANNATSYDVLNLMCEMKKRVSDKFGIELIPEIKFLGGRNKNEVKLCEYLKVK